MSGVPQTPLKDNNYGSMLVWDILVVFNFIFVLHFYKEPGTLNLDLLNFTLLSEMLKEKIHKIHETKINELKL